MKVGLYAALLSFVLGLAIVIGCGGGGGGGGTGGPGGGPGGGGGGLGTDAPIAGQYIEFVDGGDIVDPLGLRTGDVIQLRAVSYDTAGNRTVLATGPWMSAGGAGGSFTLTSGGLLTINSPTTFFQISVSATIAGGSKILIQDGRASADTSIVNGRVVDSASGTGVKYIQVEFFNAGGIRVGAALTGDNGNFSAVVPSSVTGVSAKGATIPATNYYRQLRYNGLDYTVDGGSCPIPFTLTSPGGTNTLPFPIRLIPTTSGPPGPPAGCI